MEQVLDLGVNADARSYIEHWVEMFKKTTGKTVDMVTMTGGRDVKFSEMSDDDAISIANNLYEMELEAASRSTSKQKPH